MMMIRRFSGTDPNYTYLGSIDGGSFGKVTKVRRNRDGKIQACKAIPFPDNKEELLEDIAREITILQVLKGCQACVQWESDIGHDTRGETIHLYMDYYNGRSLKDYINERIARGSEPLDEDMILGAAEDISNALQGCHKRGIIHRDIKPGNVLRHTYDPGEYVPDAGRSYPYPVTCFALADFGLSKFSSGRGGPLGSLGSRNVGTVCYAAPESVGRRPVYGPKSDIFSLGCILFELCELRLAFCSLEKTSVPAMRSSYSRELKAMTLDCLDMNPARRPSAESLLRRVRALKASRGDLDDSLGRIGLGDGGLKGRCPVM